MVVTVPALTRTGCGSCLETHTLTTSQIPSLDSAYSYLRMHAKALSIPLAPETAFSLVSLPHCVSIVRILATRQVDNQIKVDLRWILPCCSELVSSSDTFRVAVVASQHNLSERLQAITSFVCGTGAASSCFKVDSAKDGCPPLPQLLERMSQLDQLPVDLARLTTSNTTKS